MACAPRLGSYAPVRLPRSIAHTVCLPITFINEIEGTKDTLTHHAYSALGFPSSVISEKQTPSIHNMISLCNYYFVFTLCVIRTTSGKRNETSINPNTHGVAAV